MAIEILSPEDRVARLIPKLDEYRRWGITHIWVIDPETRKVFVYTEGLRESQALTLPEHSVNLTPADLFN